jgi:hypothetical protein
MTSALATDFDPAMLTTGAEGAEWEAEQAPWALDDDELDDLPCPPRALRAAMPAAVPAAMPAAVPLAPARPERLHWSVVLFTMAIAASTLLAGRTAPVSEVHELPPLVIGAPAR